MNLDFNLDAKDFFGALGITEEDYEILAIFKRVYYTELEGQAISKKKEGKLNKFQLQKYIAQLSSRSKMFKIGLEWLKESKRKDQVTILLLADIIFSMADETPLSSPLPKKQKKGQYN